MTTLHKTNISCNTSTDSNRNNNLNLTNEINLTSKIVKDVCNSLTIDKVSNLDKIRNLKYYKDKQPKSIEKKLAFENSSSSSYYIENKDEILRETHTNQFKNRGFIRCKILSNILKMNQEKSST